MPCYKPLDAFELIGKHNQKANGKKTILFKRPQETTYKQIQVPCGQCIGCRLLRSVTWASRCMHEKAEHDEACFITLTYDDKHLPHDHSLRKDHFKDFIKRFRKAIHPVKIRYYMCGEYGEETWRPHYHAIIYGYDFSQGIKYQKQWCERRQQVQINDVSNPYYISSFLSKLWTYGMHTIAECTYETAAYIARYCTKKITGDKADEHYNRLIIDWNEFTGEIDHFQEVQLEPEYSTMSKGRKEKGQTGSGIGAAWYAKYKKDCYPSNYLINDGYKTPIPKYYDKLLEMEDEQLFNEMKIKRELALAEHAAELTPQRLEQRHQNKLQQYKTLRRNKI